MAYSCNDAMDDIQEVMMNVLCPRCPDKEQGCWDDWNGDDVDEPDLESLAGCVCGVIREYVKGL